MKLLSEHLDPKYTKLIDQDQLEEFNNDIKRCVESDYIFFGDKTKYLVEALSNYENIEGDYEAEADELLLFYLRINTEYPAIVKVYKAADIDDRWEMSVVEGDNTALDEMEFDPEFTKTEIIEYLADIYEDIEEIDEEFFEDVIDDKQELDDDFYESS